MTMRDEGRVLRLATWNVHRCVGIDRRHDPARVAAVIAEIDADVVALQEFSYPADVAIEVRTPVVLDSLDRYAFMLGPVCTRRDQCYGNVLLTRHAIREVQRVDLSHRRREPRGALAATIDYGGGEIHVLSTHLGLRLAERRDQVRKLMAHIDERRPPVLAVIGDFNDWLPGRSIAHVLDERLGRSARLRTFPSFCPLLALDRIWVSPSPIVKRVFVHTSRLARVASDHLPVVADLALPA